MRVISTATVIGAAFKNAGRASEILTTFARHGFATFVQRMKLERLVKGAQTAEEPHVPVPVRLRRAFEELGPTFVKLGQLLASRPDLIPESYIEEFERLQDNVSSVPFPQIKAHVEAELGKPLEAVFADFDETPIAAASIGQVHGAILKTGEKVAVKIQRPGIEPLIQNDVSILRGIAQLLERYVPETKTLNPVGLVEEFFRTILYELDFLVEANNIRRIKKNLENLPKIRVPKVYTEFSTPRVLVLERFEGIRFTDRKAVVEAGINPMDIVSAGSDAFSQMVMRDGLFHADLHGGNLFVLPDGTIGIIDFGIVGRLSHRVQDSILSMFTALIDEDFETVASEYLDLCQATGSSDPAALQKDLMDVISPYMGMRLGQVNVGKLLLRSTSIAAKHNLQVPRELMLLFKAIFTIEALGKKLEPEFDILQVGYRQARSVLTLRYSKERVFKDLIVIGRDLQLLAERIPRIGKRFLRQWAQSGFAFETRSPDTARLARAFRQFTYHAVAAVLALSLTALGIVLLILDRGPWILGVPVWAFLALSSAFSILGQSLWVLRKARR